jgi:hypothetical protein
VALGWFFEKLFWFNFVGRTGLLAGAGRTGAISRLRKITFSQVIDLIGFKWSGRLLFGEQRPGEACYKIVFLLTSVCFAVSGTLFWKFIFHVR